MTVNRNAWQFPWAGSLGAAIVGGYCLLLFHAMNEVSYDVWGGLVIGPLLLAMSWPILHRVSQSTPDPWLPRLLWAALVLKLSAGAVRYWVAFVLYDGVADAKRYDEVGKLLAGAMRAGHFQVPEQGLTGTGFLMVLTGIVYFAASPSLIGGYLVFSWLGFWGLFFIYQAFRTGVPEGDHRRFARLLFFLPSMLFWPSGIGKEAWMLLCIGLTALGATWLFTRHRYAFVMLGAGLAGTATVRPHVALMLFSGIFFGFLFRSDRGQSMLAPLWKAVGVALLIGTGFLLLSQASAFLGVEGGLNEGAIDQQLQRAGERTDEGGSSFRAQPVGSPADLPRAAVTVLFRPFPWEAGNVQSFITAVEGALLIALIALSASRLKNLPRFAVRRPFVMMCIPFVLLFVVGFANFGNFGILARQRVQVYPFVLALICLPAAGLDRQDSRKRQRPGVYPERPPLEEGSIAR